MNYKLYKVDFRVTFHSKSFRELIYLKLSEISNKTRFIASYLANNIINVKISFIKTEQCFL